MHVSRHVSARGLTDTRSAICRRVPATCVTTMDLRTVQGTVVTLLTADSSGTAVISHGCGGEEAKGKRGGTAHTPPTLLVNVFGTGITLLVVTM
jgi:hypothetical protein